MDPKPKNETEPKEAETPVSQTGPQTGEVGGPKGPEPTRFGDWEIGGKCVDF